MEWQTLSRPEWDSTWEVLPPFCRDVYSHPAYHDVCAAWLGARPECACLRISTGCAFYSYLRSPIEGFSTPRHAVFDAQTPYGYGGPVFCGHWSDQDRVAALVALERHLAARHIVAEFVRCRSDGFDASNFVGAGYRVSKVRTNVECELAGRPLETVVRSWHKMAQRNIERAREAALSYIVAGGASHVAEFERLYRLTADRREMDSFYRFDAAHLGALLSVDPDLVKLVLVAGPGSERYVSGAILFLGADNAYYHLGASDLNCRAIRPNDFLFLALVEVASAHGARKIVWGGGLSNDPSDSLYRFKGHFATHHVPVHIACRVIDAELYEGLCREWDARHPQRREANHLFLRYRG